MGGLGSAIVIAIVIIVWVVKGLSALLGNKDADANRPRQRRSLEDWDELQARRRAELAEQSRQRQSLEEIDARALGQQRPMQSGPIDPSQMTMAQRIELARQRARQQQGGVPHQADLRADEQAEALRRAQAHAEREAQRRRAIAQQQHNAQRELEQQQRAARERARQVAERKRLAEQRALAEREQQRLARASRRRSASGAKQAQAEAKKGAKAQPSQMRLESYQRVHQGHEHKSAATRRPGLGVPKLGPLDAASLRKALILKELLDKPLAMRNPQDDLLS